MELWKNHLESSSCTQYTCHRIINTGPQAGGDIASYWKVTASQTEGSYSEACFFFAEILDIYMQSMGQKNSVKISRLRTSVLCTRELSI